MTDQTPTTEAGRRHIDQSACDVREVLAIEAEARADALREAADAVRALPRLKMVDFIARRAVLAILDPEAS